MLRKSAAFVIFLGLVLILFGIGDIFAQEPTPNPDIDLSASLHDYGMVKVGYGEDWVLQIANRGLGRLEVYDVSSDNPNFQITEPDQFPQSVGYSGGPNPDTLYVTVTYTPSSSGFFSGRLTVVSNDADEDTLHVSLEGTGVAPEINLFETTHDFNGVVVGSAAEWTVVINNTGPAELVINEIVSTDPNFILSSPTEYPQTIPSGGRLNVVTTFVPTSEGVKTANLIIRNDDPDESTLFVSLLGQGLAANIALSSQIHDYGEHMISTSTSWDLMIYNIGSLDLIISQAFISPPDFRVLSPAFPQTIDPAGSLAVEIAFEPITEGSIQGNLLLRSNDPDQSEITVTLLGAGIPRSPDIVVSSVSHDFGDVLVGTSSTWTLSIQNAGLALLNVTSAITDQAEFSVITPTFPRSIFEGLSLDVIIAYTPTSSGERSSVLTIGSDDPDEPEITISLFGRGVAPDVALSATSHNYGNVVLGTSSVWPLTIFNEGTADLVVESVVPSHPNFSMINNSFPLTIPPGESATEAIVFTPSSLGFIAANLTVNTNDPKDPVLLVSVSGMGVKPDIFLSDDSHEFGSVFVGDSAPWLLSVRNLGTAPLTVTAVFSNNPAFTIPEPTFPLTVEPGDEQLVTVRFTPTEVGEVSGNLSVISNDPETETLVIQLHGYGAPPPAPRLLLAENTHNYEMVDIGASSQWRIYIYNRGDLDLVVSDATSDNPDFHIIHPPTFPQTVGPLSHTHLTVDFIPTGQGTRTGHISVFSNDPDNEIVSVTLTGYGSAPDIQVASLSYDYGKVLLLNPQPWVMNVFNQGSKPLTVTDIRSDTEEFVVSSPNVPQILQPGTAIDVVVTFTPVSKGPKTGTITITSDDPYESEVSVQVAGTGVSSEIHLSDTGYHYGSTTVGDTSTWTFIITNVGDEDLLIDRVVSSHPDFTVLSPSFPLQLRKYCGIEILLAFTPSSEGLKEGSLTVYSNDSFQPCAPLQIQGHGIAPDIGVSTHNYDYGDVLMGQSRSWNLMISNQGDVELVVEGVVTDLNDFSIDSPAFPQTVEPGHQLAVVTVFSPADLGERSGHLTIYSDDYDEGVVTINLAGRGVTPEINLSAMSHDFGQIWAGDCTMWTFTVTNMGSSDLIISSIEGDCPDFTILEPTDFPQKIHPRCDLEVTVSFCPETVGLSGCPLVLDTNHPDVGQITVQLEGEGVLPEIAVSDVEHNFGGLALDESSEWSVTISNRGTAPLTIDHIQLTNTVDFSIPDYTFPFVIDPKGTLDIPIIFEPQSSTHKESDLIISSDDPSNPVLTLHLKGKGLVRDIQLSDKSHAYGSIVVGQQSEWSFTVTNLGQLTLDITDVVTNHSDFTVTDPAFPHTLSNGQHVDVTVAFIPTSMGAKTCTVNVLSNDPDEGILSVTLSGVGVAPELELSSYSRDFGDVLAGDCSTWTMWVYNLGTYTLELLSVTTDHADYSAEVNALPLLIAPGDSQNVVVAYCPSEPGPASGNVMVCVDGSIDDCLDIPMSGNGIIPDIAFSAPSHDYGPVYVGGTSNWVLMILNVGTSELTVSDCVSDLSQFTIVSPDFPQTIQPENSIGVVIAFTPDELGSVSGNLTITSDDPNEGSVAIPLAGEGVLPGFHLSDSAHDFGEIIAGDSADWTFTISNTGGARLTITQILSDHPEFMVTGPAFPQSLGPGEDLDVHTIFAPVTSGYKFGTLTITTDDPLTPGMMISLNGRAVVTGIYLSDNQHDFGRVLVGETADWTLTLSNGGRSEMTVLSITSEAPEFVVISEEFPFTMAPGESIEVGVEFMPSAHGPFEALLIIDIADFSGESPTIQLTGEGIQQDIVVLSLAHDYGNVVVGDSATWELTIANAGTDVLVIDSIFSDHPAFIPDPLTYPIIVHPELYPAEPTDIQVKVRFQPTSATPYEARLTILSNDPDEGQVIVALTGRGVDANVYTSASFHDFGDVMIGGSEEWAFRLHNLGKIDLHVEDVVADCDEFQVESPEFPQTIGRGAHVDITVSFNPLADEEATCTLRVVTDDPDEGTLYVVLSGRGIGRQIGVMVEGIGFGAVRIGSSAVQTLTVYNHGFLELTVNEMIPSHDDYTVVEPALPFIVGAVDSVEVTIAFTPSEPGPAEGLLDVGSDDPAQPLLTVTLSGEGITPEVDLLATDHDYGQVYVGTVSNWVLVVQNTGTDDLIVAEISSDNSDFVVLSPEFPLTVPPEGSMSVVVQFTPQDIGATEGALTVVTDDLDEGTLTVTLRGEGALPDIELSATSHDFGDVVAGDTSLWTLTISNLGTANLELSAIASDEPAFIVLSPSFFPQTMPPASDMDVTVAFVPLAGREIYGQLTIQSNDPAEPQLVVNLMGVGTAADLYIADDDHDFGDVVIGDTAPWVLPVHNIGRAPLIVHTSIIQNGDFQLVSPTFPQTIQTGQHVNVTFHFIPSVPGQIDGLVTFSSNDVSEPTFDVVLRGNGVSVPLLEVVDGFGDPGSDDNTVTIDLHTPMSVAGVEFSLTYNSTLLTITDAQLTGYSDHMGVFDIAFPHADQVVILVQDLDGGVLPPRSGSVVEFTLRVSSDAPMGELPLNLIGVILYGTEGEPLPVTTEDGIFTVTVPDISVPVRAHDYGHVPINTPVDWSCLIHNEGTKNLIISDIPTGHLDFYAIVPTFPCTVAVAESIMVTFRFAPSAIGDPTVQATVISNDPDEGELAISLSGVGIKPDICIGEVIHDFGEVVVGTSATWTAPIANLGVGDLLITEMFTVGSDFSVDVLPNILYTVPEGDTIFVDVTFAPSMAGAIRGSLVVVSNDPLEGRFVLPLWGTGIAPDIELSSMSHEFGEVDIGAEKIWDFVIYNTGRADLVVDSVTSQPNQFTVLMPEFSHTVTPGGSLVVSSAFSPTFIEGIAGSLTVFSNDPDEHILSIALSGRGAAPDIDLTAQSYIFSRVKLGESEEWEFSVANVGTRDLIIESITPDAPDFIVTAPTFPQTLEPREDVTVQISFQPVTVGMIHGKLTIVSNDPDEDTLFVTMMGHGAEPEIELSVVHLDFGAVALGASEQQPVMIRNTGDAELIVSELMSSHADFAVDDFTFPVTVSKRGSLEVTVTFRPTTMEALQESLLVASDDTNEPVLYIGLTGEGIPPATLTMGNGHGTPGSENNAVFVYLDNTVSVATARFLINFDPDKLTVSDVLATSRIDNMGSFDWDIPHAGEILVVISDFGEEVIEPGSGAIVRVGFDVASEADFGTVPLTLTGVALFDLDEGDIFTGVENGFFTVSTSYVYNFGDVAVGENASISLEYDLPGYSNCDLILGDIDCDHPDFTIAAPCHCPLVVSSTNNCARLSMTILFSPSQQGEEWAVIELSIIEPEEKVILLPVVGRGVATAQDSWTVDLVCESSDMSLPDSTRIINLSFGVDPEGTDGLDRLDVAFPPPPPNGFDFEAYFPDDIAFKLLTDIRNSSHTTIEWIVETGGTAGTISWDPADLPEGEFKLNGTIDMTHTGEASFVRNETLTINYTSTQSAVQLSSLSIQFGEGWATVLWETAYEDNITGFNLYRVTQTDVQPTIEHRLNRSLITGARSYAFTDKTAEPGEVYYYWVEAISTDGSARFVGSVSGRAVVPQDFVLSQNYPNPFNPETHIRYALDTQEHVSLMIYNALGQKVRTLVKAAQSPGTYTVVWNGHDDQGQLVPTGAYFYRITVGTVSETKKMVMLK